MWYSCLLVGPSAVSSVAQYDFLVYLKATISGKNITTKTAVLQVRVSVSVLYKRVLRWI